jgi:CxxC motif-containing protein
MFLFRNKGVRKVIEETKIICIGCPKGCSISINHDRKSIKTIDGYSCKNGLEYAQNEFTAPKRTLTSTVKVKFGELPVVSVKTKNPILKDKIFECMREINELEVEAPIKIGTVIKVDIAQTGVDLITTETINKI